MTKYLDGFIPQSMSQAIKKFSGLIPIKRLILDYVRSSGPGGQLVNKKNTKVILSFHLETAEWLTKDIRENMARIHRGHINKDGFMMIRSEKNRSQSLNIDDCLDKLRIMIAEAEQPEKPEPSEEESEIRRKRLEKANIERLEEKKHKSMLIKMRNVDISRWD